MGALPNNDKPEGIGKEDIIFYLAMAIIIALAWLTSEKLPML